MATLDIEADVRAINRLDAVQTALEVLRQSTGMRLAIVVRVTEDTWTTCAILDDVGLGLEPGSHLDLSTTF